MSRVALSQTGSWKLKDAHQDVRGCRAVDSAGTTVGLVDAMIVDTDAERVDTIVLEDGREFAARDITISEDGNTVVLNTVGAATATADAEPPESVTTFDDYGHVVARAAVDDFDEEHLADHADAFRTHHGTAYASTSYDEYEPAYRYGFESAYGADYRDRVFADVEDDLRSGYSARDYDADRDAIRYGYSRAQTGNRS